MSLSAAKSRVNLARENLESGRTDGIESILESAEASLDGLPDEEAAPVRAQIAAIRTELTGRASPEAELAIRGARYKLTQVENWVGMGYPADEIELGLRAAVEYLMDVPDVHKAQVLADIAAFRARHAGAPATGPDDASTAATRAPEHAGSAAGTHHPTDDELSLIRRAKTSMMWARENQDEDKLREAEGLLADVGDVHRAPLLAEIDAIRRQLVEAADAEELRRVTQFIEVRLAGAEEGDAGSLAYCFGRLASVEVRKVLPTAVLERFQARLDAAFDNRRAALRATALGRADPLLRTLEGYLRPDLLSGLSEGEVDGVVRECRSLTSRVLDELRAAGHLVDADVWSEARDEVAGAERRAVNARLVVAADDAAFRAVRARLAVVDDAVTAAVVAWRKTRLDAEVANRWRTIQAEFEGWREESLPAGRRPLEPADLPLTHLAIVRTGSMLREPDTIEIRRGNAGDPAIEATYQDAEQVLRAAHRKLDAAFGQVLDEAERMTPPLDELDLDGVATDHRSATDRLIGELERSLAGSSYLEPAVARVRRLNERWQTEIATAIRARREQYDRLAAEAAARWPEIVANSGATARFDPTDPDAIGTVVLLRQVYNRAGWDFDGCDFATRWDGTPVSGQYADHVRRALDHAHYGLKLDVSDRIGWDVVGVVEGPGRIGARTSRTLRDAHTNFEIGTVEEWPPVDCTRLRIIALHAGPVAVGPVAVGPPR
jgi:hypothetical protein